MCVVLACMREDTTHWIAVCVFSGAQAYACHMHPFSIWHCKSAPNVLIFETWAVSFGVAWVRLFFGCYFVGSFASEGVGGVGGLATLGGVETMLVVMFLCLGLVPSCC